MEEILSIVIAPLRFGAGIKGKIIEAMAKGAAIITTNCGAEGIEDANRFMSNRKLFIDKITGNITKMIIQDKNQKKKTNQKKKK